MRGQDFARRGETLDDGMNLLGGLGRAQREAGQENPAAKGDQQKEAHRSFGYYE